MPALLPSELPVRARTRHHWVVLWRRPHKLLTIALLVLLVAAIVDPNPMAWLLGIVVAVLGFLRCQTWNAERIILTGQRIIRVRGVPETTSSEASLRIDRISGARMIQTVPGKLFGYGTIELEAPGDHPDVRKLTKIAHPKAFYLELRSVVFGEPVGPDPDVNPVNGDVPEDFITEPLPPLPVRDRFGHRGY